MVNIISRFAVSDITEVTGMVLVTLACLFLYKRGKTDFVRRLILAFVTEAEKRYGSGTGELKYIHVVERIYEVLPWILRMLYSKEQIDQMIEDAVEYLKRYLAEDRNLLGHE